MSTSNKTRASIRQGGPGASEENAKAPLEIKKPPADTDQRTRSKISGGGGEHDRHHSHDPERKGDTRPARPKGAAAKAQRPADQNADENYVTPAPGRHISNADKKHFGKGTHGKRDGSGAMTDIPKDMIGENMVLSNRDKAQHSRQRGLDGKAIKTEQYQDHAAGRLPED
jgi:hypothetical protein